MAASLHLPSALSLVQVRMAFFAAISADTLLPQNKSLRELRQRDAAVGEGGDALAALGAGLVAFGQRALLGFAGRGFRHDPVQLGLGFIGGDGAVQRIGVSGGAASMDRASAPAMAKAAPEARNRQADARASSFCGIQ